MGAGRDWAEALSAWAIPDDILAAAPESPWSFDPDSFVAMTRGALARRTPTPTRQRALEELPDSGTVIDVGAGTGAASLPLAPRAGRVVAVDRSAAMLAGFAALADEVGIAHREIIGDWPDVAPQAGEGEVVVCAHVLYNVPDLAAFASALTCFARRRVVCEISASHPQSALNPLWERFHALRRPQRPTASDAVEVLREAGLDVRIDRWTAPERWIDLDRSQAVAQARRRLCLPVDREPEVDAALGAPPRLAPAEMATLWWNVPR